MTVPGAPAPGDAAGRMTGPPAPPRHVSMRSRAALTAASALSGLSRATRLGSGSVIGGQLAVLVHRGLLAELSSGRQVALVSGTNGKTTTNHFLAAALGTLGPVATNADGANMDAGMVVALGAAPAAARAALECDELWLPEVLRQTGPAVVVLLNLSRDQLDRTQEVRSTADLWRAMLSDTPASAVVANADDPLVAWAAWGAPAEVPITWVGTGTWWTLDATGCPACGGRIGFDADGWACGSCGFARPDPEVWLDGDDLCLASGTRVPLPLALPGRANRANAAMAAATASLFGIDPQRAVDAMAPVTDVAGRYRTETVGGQPVRLLLAKNPAGWQEALEMVRGSTTPAVVSINARIADGRDPSWLWDVPFEELRGRFVVAAGERRHDLAVRLAYAEVDHVTAGSLADAVAAGTAHPSARGTNVIDVIGNYTALQDHLGEVDRVRHGRDGTRPTDGADR
jgi:lipid II isoglutaminyl synthase (glutamine-hydrolysing)